MPQMSNANEKPDVWVGLKPCGCCVAVVVDRPEWKKDTEKDKRNFLKQGLSVVRGSWTEWTEKYLPSLQTDCTHGEAK